MKLIRGWFAHAWITLLVAGVVIALDQWTKMLVRANLPKFDFVPVLGDFFGWQHVDNYGASFGLFQDARLVLTVVAIVVTLAILVYVRYVPQEQVVMRVLLGLMVGGAVGNLIDRVMRGYVTDFIVMRIPGVYAWPNFNIADMAIVVGTILLAVYIIWEDTRAARAAKSRDHLPSND
jgi:signal peptidase II